MGVPMEESMPRWGWGVPPEKFGGWRFRCSSLPRLMACPASATARPDPLIDASSPQASFGNAVHEIMARIARDQLSRLPFDLESVAALHGVTDLDDFRSVCYAGLRALRDNLGYIRQAHVEEACYGVLSPHVCLTGTPDHVGVARIDGHDTLTITDYKTGTDEIDPFHQLMGYASIMSMHYPELHYVRLITVYLRLRDIDTTDVTKVDLDHWRSDLARTLRDEGDRFGPSEPTCRYCPMRFTCVAHEKMGQTYSRLFLEGPEASALSTKEAVAAAAKKVFFIEKKIKEFREYLRLYVDTNGALDMGEGRELALVDSQRETIHLDKNAYRILREKFGRNGEKLVEHLQAAITVKKSVLNKLVSDLAARGEKGAAIEAMLDSLRDAGSISTTPSNRMQTRKRKEGQDE